MSTPPDRPDEVPLPLAAELAAIPARTLRNWIKSGKLAAKRGQRGWLVRMADIERIAIMIGHPVATTRPAVGMAGPPAVALATDAPAEARHEVLAANSGQLAANAAMVAADRQADAEAQLQRLLAPFIAELGAVREELGHVKAERDGQAAMVEELRRRAEAAEAARTAVEGERDALRLRLDTAQAVPAATAAPTVLAVEVDPPRRPPGLWGRLWRTVRGG